MNAEKRFTPNILEAASPALFFLLLAGVTIFHYFYLSAVPLSGDEAYHWEWSRNLDLSYYDHPPMAAWMIALSTALFGTTLTAVRLPALFSMTASFVLIYLIVFRLFKDKKTASLAGILALFVPIFTIGSILMTTDPPLGLFYVVFMYAFLRALNGSRLWWYAAGAALGAAMLCKFIAYLLVPSAFFYLVFSREHRHWLFKKEPYLAFVAAAVVFSPVVYWNYHHDWSTFLFNFSKRHTGARFGFDHIIEYIGAQMIVASPLIFIAGAAALVKSGWRGVFGRDYRFLFVFAFAAAPLSFFGLIAAFERVSLHWTAIAYFPLMAALAAAACSLTRYKKAAGVFITVSLAVAFLVDAAFHLVPLAPKILPFEYEYSKWKGGRISTNKLREVYGWEEMGAAVKAAYDSLPKEKGAFIATPTYTMSGLVAFYTPAHPRVYWMGLGYEGVNGLNYRYWDDFPALKGQNAVFVAAVLNDDRKAKLFESFEKVEEMKLPIHENGVLMRTFLIFKCYNFSGINPR